MPTILDYCPTSVLLIDANQDDRTCYVEGLKRCAPDHLILEAEDGQTGRQVYGCVRVDCVVLELSLPDQSGFGLLQHFLASSPNVAVLILTQIAHPRLSTIVKQFGAHAYLEKAHTSPEDLGKAIHLAVAMVGEMPKDDWCLSR